MSFGVGPVLGAIVPQASDDPPQSEWPGWTGVLFANEFMGPASSAVRAGERLKKPRRPKK